MARRAGSKWVIVLLLAGGAYWYFSKPPSRETGAAGSRQCGSVQECLSQYDFESARRFAASLDDKSGGALSDQDKAMLKIISAEAAYWARKGNGDRALNVAKEALDVGSGESEYSSARSTALSNGRRILAETFGTTAATLVANKQIDSARRYFVAYSALVGEDDFNTLAESFALAVATHGDFVTAKRIAQGLRPKEEYRPDLDRRVASDFTARDNLLARVLKMEETDALARGDDKAIAAARRAVKEIEDRRDASERRLAKIRAQEEEREERSRKAREREEEIEHKRKQEDKSVWDKLFGE